MSHVVSSREVKKKRSTTFRTLQFFWQVTKIQWSMFFMACFSTALFVFSLSYMNPFIVGKIVDLVGAGQVEPNQVWEVFGPYMVALIAANVVGQTCSKLQDYFAVKTEIRASYELATQAFDTLSNQSMTFHTNRFGGSLVSQTQKFMGAYVMLMESFVYAIIPITCSAIFAITILSTLVPQYAVVLVFMLIIYAAVSYILYKRILPLNSQAAASQNALSGALSDSITNIMAVKTSGREAYERQLFDEANVQVREADSIRMRATIMRGVATSSLTVVIMTMLVIFISGGNAWFGISAGTLVMMFTYTHSLTMQFNRLTQVFRQVNRAFGDAHDMTIILDEPRLVADDEDAPALLVDKGVIDIDDLSFHYSDEASSGSVFEDFSLHIPAGQRVGLVGRSGSGKTTLTTLLLRLADIQEGEILIDGQNIAHVAQTSLRHQIAYVPQEPLLFHRTIRENIAYGCPGASDEEIIEAAKRAHAMEFIEKFPQGLDTLTGERGVKLSGGQRQRIAIARAILTDAPILILDEATSALDSESEKLIQEALINLMRGRTSIVIAHRLSTVASLDRIVVLSDGAIVEDGTHEQLVAADGEYAHLWNRQSGAFFGDE